MNPNVKPNDRATILGVIDPDAYGTGDQSTAWIAAKDFGYFMAIVFAGTLGSSATLDAKIEQATSAAGAGAKDLTGKAITQLTQAGTDSDKQAVINLRPDELDLINGYTHFRLTMSVGTATSDAGGAVLGFDARYQPPTDAATVDEVVG